MGLLVSCVIRLLVSALLRIGNPTCGFKRDYSYEPTVSILLPCFNEGRAVYETIESICRSHYPKEKFEIVAIDDCSSDDSYDWLLKAKNDFGDIQIRASRNPRNSGKADTQATALEAASGEVILCIDSDAIFDPDAIRELTACFGDPKIGAVGGAVGVRNINKNILTACQALVYAENFHFLKVFENWTQSVICLSGCMLAVRRELFVKVQPKIAARNFFGLKVKDGEDRFLTHMVQMEGFGTVINPNAKCLTNVPDNLPTLWNQQIRWQRSGIRDFCLTLRTLHTHIWDLSPNPNFLYGLFFPTLAALISIFLLLLNPLIVLFVAPFWVAFYFVMAVGYDILTRRSLPEQRISSPYRIISLAAFSVWIVAGRLIELCALCTLDSTSWMTRQLAPAPRKHYVAPAAVRLNPSEELQGD
jgi:cellulose synthase/poly-beta-1,6-N-acetylglucosamine synthase-like glycosyltransferase